MQQTVPQSALFLSESLERPLVGSPHSSTPHIDLRRGGGCLMNGGHEERGGVSYEWWTADPTSGVWGCGNAGQLLRVVRETEDMNLTHQYNY